MELLPSLVTIITLFISLLLVLLLLRKLRSPKLPPGPTPYPIVGNLYQVKPLMFRCFAEWSQKYGPVMSVWFGTTLNVVVSSPDMAKEVLKTNDHFLSDRPRNRATARFSRDGMDLVWADYGPHYVKVRKLCNLELFSTKRLEALRPVREEEVTAMVESIFKSCSTPQGTINGSSLVLRNHLSSVAFNNITRLAFGKRFMNSDDVMDDQGLEFKAIGVEGMKFGASISLGEYVSWLEWMFPLDEVAFGKHSARRDQLTRDIMNEHTLARNKNGAKQHFVDALLTLQEKYDLSEDTIIVLLWDMITAGMDTTVITVEWAMTEIVKNPRIQLKVQEELDRVVGVDRIMDETDFAKLPYLHCVVKEALRLHPPTPLMLPHKATDKTKIGGYDIPKGTVIHVNAWAIARDPLLWKDPLEFRPERFEEENIDIKGNDFRILPFGAGRRVCPGAQLGILLIASMLGHLLHHFEWKLPEGMKENEVDMSEAPGLVTYKSTPLQAVAVPRLETNLYKSVTCTI